MAQSTSIAKITLEKEEYVKSRSYWERVVYRLSKDKMTMLALIVLFTLIIVTGLSSVITNNILHIDPNDTDPMSNFLPPLSAGHLLGTDDIGRDQLARLLHAGSVSIRIGVLGAFFSLSIGLVAGTISGFFGGIFDDIMNWIITTVDSIPALYLLILFSTVFEPSAETLIMVIALISWTGPMRLVRGQMLSLRENDYVLAARALGANAFRIIFVHILPNLLSIAVIAMALSIANLILVESALSYLGLGVQPPQATWGNMLSKSQQFFRQGAHLVIFPGVMIFITVLCAYVVGDGIRDALDPTTAD